MKNILTFTLISLLIGCSSTITYLAGTPVVGYHENLPVYHNLDVKSIDRHPITFEAIITDVSKHDALINKNEINNSLHTYNQTNSLNVKIQQPLTIIETIPAPIFQEYNEKLIKVPVYLIKVQSLTYNHDTMDLLQADRGENFQIGDNTLIQANEFGKWEIFKK